MRDKAVLHRPHRGVSAAERQQARRSAFVAAGLELFGTQGVTKTTVDQVCAQAGLTKRYFYESFASLNALVDAVIDEIFAQIIAGLLPLVAENGWRNPRAPVTYFVHTVLADPRIAHLLFVEADSGALSHRRQPFIDMAVTMWLSADPTVPDDTARREQIRMGAYAYAGACREVILANVTGRITFSADEIAEHLTQLLATMSAQFESPSGPHRAEDDQSSHEVP